MATEQAKCDDCKKQDCPQRLVGALCSINMQLMPLIDSVNSRDPLLVSRFIVSVVGSEYERYQKAKKVEKLGKKTIKQVVGKMGDIIDVEVENSVDNNVSTLAMNIIKSGKLLNEILNPPKVAPFNQTNIQNNFGAVVADEIRALGGEDRDKTLKFIDDKLDAKREG